VREVRVVQDERRRPTGCQRPTERRGARDDLRQKQQRDI
jgi:hypothetical protein